MNYNYKALALLAMLYQSLMILANIMIYRLTTFNGIVISVGSFIIPFWYLLGDIICEVYGYQIFRRIIWAALFNCAIFSFLCALLINFPSVQSFEIITSYNMIFSRMPRVLFGMVAAILIGTFINAFLISQWKILIKGKHFWLRSLGTSGIGQFLFTSISMTFDLFNIIPMNQLLKMIAFAYLVKLIFTPLAVGPSCLIAKYLKKFENLDVYDYSTNFNPFRWDVKY